MGVNVSKPWSDNAGCTLRGGVARQSEDRNPKRMTFGSLLGRGEDARRCRQHWKHCLEEDLRGAEHGTGDCRRRVQK